MTEVTLGIKITADGKIARAEVKGLSSDLNKLETAGKKSADGIKQSGSAAAQASRQFDTLGISAGKLAGYFSAFALVGYTKALIDVGDRASLLAARLQLVTNGARQFAAVQQQLYAQAQNVGISIESQADLYAKLARATEGTGRSAKDLLTITDVIAKNLKISGTSAGQAAGAMLQFGQAAGSGVVHAEEFNSMLEGMPTLVQGVAKALGLTVSELKNLVNQGQITSAQWLDAMVKMREATDEQVSAMGSTFEQAMQRMANSFFKFNAEVANQSGISKFFQDLANGVSSFLDRWTDNVDPVKSAIMEVQDASLKLFELQQKFDRNPAGTNIIEKQYQATELAKANQALDDANKKLELLQPIAKRAADSLAEGFGKAKYEIADVGKTAQATLAAVLDTAKRYNVPGVFAEAIFQRETGWAGKNYQSLVSPKGAIGTMQLMPDTARRLGVDAKDAMQNIEGGVKLLAMLLKKYGDDFKKAAAAYNAGEGAVDRYGGTPPYKETREYVAFVEDFMRKHPGGVELINARDQKSDIQQARSEMDSLVQSQLAAAKAAETIKKSELAVQVAINAGQRKAFEDFTKSQADGMSGDQKIRYLEQAAQQEARLVEQGILLKQRAIQIEQQSTQAELDGINRRIAAADRLHLTEAERISLNNQQKQAMAELSSLTEQHNVVAIQGAGELRDVLSGVADAYSEQAEQVKKAAEARADIIAKLKEEIDALKGVASAQDEVRAAEKASSGVRDKAYDADMKQIKDMVSERNSLKKAKEDEAKQVKDVADEVVRMQGVYRAMSQQAQEAASVMAQSMGDVGQAIGGVVVAMTKAQEYSYNNLVALNEQIDKINKAKDLSAAEKASKIELATSQAQSKELSTQLTMYGNMAVSMRGMFKEGTQGYATLNAAASAFSIAQMAMTMAETVAKGVEAVVNQGSSGDPYTAIPRMMGMIAMLASLGVAISGGGSGSVGSKGATGKVTAQNKGTVFGDESAVSKSIANSLEILKGNSSADLDYSARMTKALESLEAAMGQAAKSLYLNVSAMTALAGKNVKLGKQSMFDPGMEALGIIGKSSKVTDFGIGTAPWDPQKLFDIIAKGIQLKAYTDVTTTTKWFGQTMSEKTKTYIGDVANETEDAFTRVIRGLADAVQEGAKAFGISSMEFQKRLAEFTVSIDPTSLKGEDGKRLTGEALQDALSAQFSAIADKMAAALNIEQLGSFQRAGEGLFETLTRVASGINEANGALEQLNIKALSYKDVVNRQAEDIGAEIVRQSIIAKEAGSSVGKFMEDVVGSLDDMVSTYQDLVAIRDLFKGMGFEAESLTRTMTEAVGGVSKLRAAMEDFNSKFFNTGEQYANQMVTLGRQFGEIGQALPGSKEAFRQLVESIDTSTESGQKLFARLVALSGAFADAADAASELESKYQSYINPLNDYKDRLDQILEDFESILDAKLGQIEAVYANKASLEKAKVNAPYAEQADITGARRTELQTEMARNVGFLNTTLSEIDRLNGLINQWQGVPKAQAYVASWRSALEGLQSQADTLRADLAAKGEELATLDARIEEVNRQIAQNSADIDASLLGDKLKALTDERSRVMREQGEVLLSSLQDFWDEMIQGIEQLQTNIDSKIAELTGPGAQLRFDRSQLSSARDAWRDFERSGKNDPAKAVELLTDLFDKTMAVYDRQMARIQKDIERRTNELERELEKATNRINRQRDRKLARVDSKEESKIEAANARIEAQIDRINAGMEAALRNLEDIQQAEQWALEDRQDAQRDALQKTHDAAMQALSDELAAANALKSAISQIKQYSESLLVGQSSTLSPEAKLAEAQRQFDKLYAQAQGGNAEAAGQVQGAAGTLIDLLRNYFGSNDQYSTAFDAIQKKLATLGDTTVTEPESVQTKIDQLKDAQSAEMKALSRTFEIESRALSRQQSDAADALRETFQSQIDAANAHLDQMVKSINEWAETQRDQINKNADKEIRDLTKETNKEIRRLSNPKYNEAIADLKDVTRFRLTNIQEKLEEQRKQAQTQMKSLIDEVRNTRILSAAQLRAMNRWLRNEGIDPEQVPSFATGGLLRAGPAIVAEQGMEPIWFDRGGRVLSNAEARASLSEGDRKIAQELAALKTELQALVTTQSAANPVLISELSAIRERVSDLERQQRLANS